MELTTEQLKKQKTVKLWNDIYLLIINLFEFFSIRNIIIKTLKRR